MIIIVRSVFEEDGKYYPQIYFNECLHDLWKYCNKTELMFRKKLKQVHQKTKTSASKECMLCHYWYFKDVYKF